MGLFDIKKRSENTESLSTSQLDEKLIEKQKEIEQLQNDINFAKQENEALEGNYLNKIRQLEEKQDFFNNQIATQKDNYNARIKKLEDKRKTIQEDYDNKIIELNKKLDVLKNAQTDLFAQKDALKAKDFEKKKKSIQAKIEAIGENIKKQNESFNNNIDETTKKYNELLAKKDVDLQAINNAKRSFIEKANEEIEKLEQQKNEIETFHKDQLRKLESQQKSARNIERAKQEKDIQLKQRELDNANAEIKSLTAFKNNLNKDLATSKSIHEKEYNSLLNKIEREKDNLLRDNEKLKEELEDRQRRYEDESITYKREYEQQVDELNELVSLLGTRGVEAERKLKEKLEQSKFGFAKDYKDYIEQLEHDYYTANQARQNELESLSFELKQEEEKLNNEKAFLDNKLVNANTSFKNAVEEKSAQIINTQVILNSLETEHNDLVKSFGDKIAALKKENAQAIKNKTNENAKQLEDIRNEYISRKQDIEQKIVLITNDIKSLKGDVDEKQKDLDSYNRSKENEKKTLLNQRDQFVEENKRIKDDIEKKIQDIKKAMEQANQEYSANLNALNNKRIELQANSDTRISELTGKYNAKIQTLKDEHDANIAKLTRAHEEKIDALNRQYDKSTGDLRLSIDEKQKQVESYQNDINGKIENLRLENERKVTGLTQQNDELVNQINSIKQRMQEETQAFDVDVKSLHEEYVNKVNELAKNQNEQIQELLNEYEAIPSQQLIQIKAEYEKAQKQYTADINEIANAKKKLIADENELKSSFAAQKDILNKEISNKSSELERTKYDYDVQQSQQSREINRLQAELDTLRSRNDAQYNSLVEQNDKDIDNYQFSLDSKYASLVRQLKNEQERTQKQFDEELRAITYDTDNKITNLNALIADIDLKRASFESQYNIQYESALKDVNASKKALQELNDRRIQENQKHVDQIDKIKADNAETLKQKQDEYDQILARTKDEYIEKSKDLHDSINDAKNNIEIVNSRIENVNRDFEDFKHQSEQNLSKLNKEYDTFLIYAKETKNEIDSKVNNYRKMINDSKLKYETDIARIKTEQEDYKKNYDRQLEDLKTKHQEKLAAMNSNYEFNVKEITNSTESTIAKLEKDYNAKVNEANADFDKKQHEYELAKSSIDSTISELTRDYEEKIRTINEQKVSLNQTIDNLKLTIENERIKYRNTIDSIRSTQENRLSEIAKQYNDSFNNIVEEEYNAPNRQLREISAKLTEVQRLYNAEVSRIEANKKEISDSLNATENHNYLQRKTIEAEIENLNNELARNTQEYEKTYADLSNQYRDKQQELDEYKYSLEKSFKQIKENLNNEQNTLKKRLDEEYNTLSTGLLEKQTDAKNTYEDDLRRIGSDIASKKANLDSLIREIEERKSSVKREYDSEYDGLAKQTNEVRAYLNTLQEEHEKKIAAYKEGIEKLTEHNDEIIKSKESEYEQSLQQARNEYGQKHQVIDDEVAATKANTDTIYDNINIIKNDFDKFLKDANARKQTLIDSHNAYMANSRKAIDDVTVRINDIKASLIERQNVHNNELAKLSAKRSYMQAENEKSIAEINSLFKNQSEEIRAEYDQKIKDANKSHDEQMKAIKNDYSNRYVAIEQSLEDKKEEYRLLKKNYKRDVETIEEDAKNRIKTLQEQESDVRASVKNLQEIMANEQSQYEADIAKTNQDRENMIEQLSRIHQGSLDQIIEENVTNPTRQLNEVKAKFEAAQKEYDDKLIQIASDKKAVDDQEFSINKRNNEQKFNADNELSTRNEEYNRLKVDYERKLNEFDTALKERRVEFESYSKEMNAAPLQYRANKEADFNNLSRDLEEQLNNLVDKNNITEQTTSSGYNKQLFNLQLSISDKIASIDRKIGAIREVKDKKQAEADEILNVRSKEINKSISQLKAQLEELNVKKLENQDIYKNTLEKNEIDNRELIDKRRRQLAEQLQDAKANFAEQAEIIKAQTVEIRRQNEVLLKKIEQAVKDYDQYAVASQQRNKIVLDEQSEYIAYIDQQKAKVDERIEKLNEELAKAQTRFDQQQAIIDAQRADVQLAYDAKIQEIESEYKEKVRKVNEDSSANQQEARNKHDNILKTLQANYEKKSEDIKRQYEEKKDELAKIRLTYKDDIEAYKLSIKERIDELANQQEELLRKISDMKDQMKQDNIGFNEDTKRLQSDYDKEIDLLNEDNRKKIAEITHTYIEIPNEDLSRITAELNKAKQDYETTLAENDKKKMELIAYEKNILDKADKLKAEANESYNKKRAQYDETADKLNNANLSLDEKLAKSKQDLDDLRASINVQIEKIKADKNADYDKYVKENELIFEKRNEEFKAIQDSLKERNDNEIAQLSEHLNAKKESIDSLINEINARKKKAEDEKIAEYNVVVAKTNQLQAELDSLVTENSLKKTSYENELASKREANRVALDAIKAKQAEDLEKRKAEAVAINKKKQQEITELSEQVSTYKLQTDEISKKLVAYEKEKNASVDNINKDLETFIASINTRIADLANKAVALNEAHKSRIVEIKTQIAQTVSDYDDLMKLKPKLINAAYEEEIDFVSVAKSFKEKIEGLESTHRQIIDSLEANRLTAIENIKQQITDIDNLKPEKLKEFEDEIIEISNAYDAMITDEKEKQNQLVNEVMAANRERSRLEQENIDNKANLEKDYSEIENDIAANFNRQLAESNASFSRISNNLRHEFETLSNRKDNLKNDLTRLNAGFLQIDDDIHNEMINLKNTYITQLVSIQAKYDAQVNSNREKLQSLDAISSDNSLLFKD